MMSNRESLIENLILKSLESENVSNSDLQKLEKELAGLEPFTIEEYSSCHDKIINNLICPVSEKKLKRITLLLEKQFKKFIQPSANILMNVLLDTIQLWLKDNVNVCQNQVHLAIRIMLQIIQYFWNEDTMKDIDTIKAEGILFEVIKNNDCVFENVMLAGTCVVRLIFAKCENLESSVYYFLKSFVANDDVSELIRLVFLTGLLNSGNNLVFLYKVKGIPLLLFIFPIILELCEKNINYIFQSFQLLLVWLSAMKKNLCHLHNDIRIDFNFREQTDTSTSLEVHNLLKWWGKEIHFKSKFGDEICPNEYYFQGTSRVFNHVFDLLTVNWENFIRGVPDLVKDCFSTLLEMHLIETQLRGVKIDVIEKLVVYYLQMPWTNRAKYPPLAILTSHYGVKKLLNCDPNLPTYLTETLNSNPLASSGADLYRVMLKKQREEEQNTNVLITSWQQIWMESVFNIICTDNSYLQQNLFRHWFPHTLAIIPEIYDVLMEEFSQISNKEGFQLASITLMSQARLTGIQKLENMDINIIHENLFHINENIRMQAFTLICCSKRKTEPLLPIEVKLIEEFLAYNLNIDNAPFRQHLITQMKCVLVRARDSCVSWISEERKSGIKIAELDDTIKFVDNVFWMIIQNLNPGARYQRRQTCLDLFAMLLDTLIAVPDVNKRKGGVPVKTPLLVAYAQKNDLWKFICDDVFHSLLCCLQDFMSEIKVQAINILQKYFYEVNFLKIEENVTKLFNQGYKWLNSPKTHVCESGSLLINFILKYKINENFDASVEYLGHLIKRLSKQFNTAKDNIMLASKSFPIHGVVLALKIFISDNDWTNSSINFTELKQLILELIDMVSDIVEFVLSILASKSNSSNQAPSFEDMGRAIENILDAEGINMDEDNPSLSVEHQLILSCCWLTLKESSFLLSKLVVKLPLTYPNKDGILNHVLVRRMAEDLINILIGCRHRGAIEACSLAMGEFCRSLSSEQLPEYRDIPKSILNSALEAIQTPNHTSSITRRSAGLPLLFVSIIANESTQRKRYLLEACINDLVRIALTSVTTECDVTDLPQTHAVHIIRALVHDSTLSQIILPHMTDIIKLCIGSFTSPVWSLRNAALQLFGSLVPRLLGQKKVRDESSKHNSITAEVFFHRYPDFKLYLTHYLEKLNCYANPAEPGLVPILSLLSKLSTNSEGVKLADDFSLLLDTFIGSPFFVVRKLTANAFIATSNKSQTDILVKMIEKLDNPDQIGVNYIHGVWLIVLQLLESNDFLSDQLRNLELCLIRCYSIIAKRFNCYFVQALILQILNKILDRKSNLFSSILEVIKNSTCLDVSKPGYSEWTKEITLIKLKVASDSEVAELIKSFLSHKNQDEILCCLKYIKMEMNENLSSEMNLFFQEQIIYLLCNNPHVYHMEESLTILQNLIWNEHSVLVHPQINSQSFLHFIKCALKGTFGTLSAACSTVFVGFYLSVVVERKELILNSDTFELLGVWCKQIHNYSDPRKAEDLRVKSAEALNRFGATLVDRLRVNGDEQEANCLLSLFRAGVTLLTDENWEIRQKASEFASLLQRPTNFHEFAKVNHNYALEIFCAYFASKFGCRIEFLDALWMNISSNSSTILLEEFIKEERLCILFEQDDINIYAEHFLLTKISSFTLTNLLTTDSDVLNIWVQERMKNVVSDANNFIMQLTTHLSDFQSINALGCYKPFICVHQLLTQINILSNCSLTNLENKKDLQKLRTKLQEFCMPSCIF